MYVFVLVSSHAFAVRFTIGQTWTDAKQRWKRERMEDWSELSEDELRTKLTEKKVLTGDNCCSEGLQNICQGCTKKTDDT